MIQQLGAFMNDPVLSPDGKFMWTGTEWIPAPPTGGNNIDMKDSVIGGDVVSNTTINNDPQVVTEAVIAALQQMGMLEAQRVPQAPPIPEIELPQSFNLGDHVEYHSPTNQRWLDRCRVIAINEDGTYKIEVPKTDLVEIKNAVVIGSAPGTIRPARLPFNVGDRVFVNWKNYGHYYPGKIMKENENHTFFIQFDDGDIEDNVEWGRIEVLNESSVEVQEYIAHDCEAEQELVEAFQVFDTNNTGTISAREYFRILTEIGDEPLQVEDVLEEFAELGIELDSEIDYRSLVKYMVASDSTESKNPLKPEVVIKDAFLENGVISGYAYDHPKLGEGIVNSSAVVSISFDERATARVETNNTIYVVGPTGWKVRPENHPFNSPFSVGQRVKVEWEGAWWDASVVKVETGSFFITYEGFDSSWDEWVGPSRIKPLS
ncbi:MAG: hypothetical protein CMB28_06380 [Euryarchaeota archaeon]|nr:hypothetical protein [Euryarchaeota archaeon]|tara:strand:+ start:1068 stop:2363 length:1296 start_codon:yes stop_codon:yes gene_type:complete